MISAILLAAGQSTRMGEANKLLLPFRGRSVIENMVDVLLASRLDEVVVVLGHQADQVRPRLEGRPVRIVENPDFREGMGSSLKVGLHNVSLQARGVMVCLTDQPLLEPADVDRLIAAFEATAQQEEGKQDIVVPFHQGQRGNPILFSARYREEVQATRGPIAGCRGIVQRYPEAILAVEMDTDHILRDLDTPEDYRALLQQAQ
ncbi:MAG TPA: nucleotidyltransferase family protein [bacterium]|nr:nucleotidyltransferase family protein [bacterium]